MNPAAARLAGQLTEFGHAGGTEGAGRGAFRALLESVEDPFHRDTFNPGHVTAGALAVAEGHLLMVHHRRLDIWIEPGGHVDPTDESVEAAAARELLEETGIAGHLVDEGIFDLDVHPIPAARGEPAHEHFNVCYLFEATLVEPSPAAEVVAARWVHLDAVSGLTPDPAVLRAVERLRARYLR